MSDYPSLVMIIRHAEKPGDPGDDKTGSPHLSVMGSARAMALPALFTTAAGACAIEPADQGALSAEYEAAEAPAGAPPFPTPKFLFATQNSKNSHRPLETITPLGQALATTPQTPFGDGDYQSQANQILNDPSTYANQVILICWHHGKAPRLAQALGVPADQLKGWDPWDPSVFDLVFMITWQDNQAFLKVAHQGLLFGDSAVSG